MTGQARPYVRVYYSIVDDPRFETVYDDDRRLATWLRLLLVADAMYPQPAPIPSGCNAAAVKHLVDVGLIELRPGKRFVVHGLATEREQRAELARSAANARHGGMRTHSVSSASAVHPHSDSNAISEPSLAEPSLAEPTREDAAALLRELTGRYLDPHSKNGDRLTRFVEKHGWAKVETTMRQVASDLGDFPEQNQLVNSLDNYLNPPISGPSLKEQRAKDENEADRRRLERERKKSAEHQRWWDENMAKATSK